MLCEISRAVPSIADAASVEVAPARTRLMQKYAIEPEDWLAGYGPERSSDP